MVESHEDLDLVYPYPSYLSLVYPDFKLTNFKEERSSGQVQYFCMFTEHEEDWLLEVSEHSYAVQHVESIRRDSIIIRQVLFEIFRWGFQDLERMAYIYTRLQSRNSDS